MRYQINYDKLAASLFKGNISDTAKRNMEIFLEDETVQEHYSKQNLAYLFATIFHETGIVVRKGDKKVMTRNMAPVEEIGKGEGRPYGKPGSNGKIFYGRGHVQLTWEDNYKKCGKFLGIDLFNSPELALDEKISAKITINGMLYGWFTGKHIKSYHGTRKKDGTDAYYLNSRRIINGTDKADLIEGYAIMFEAALT